jgi:hypothetical protein
MNVTAISSEIPDDICIRCFGPASYRGIQLSVVGGSLLLLFLFLEWKNDYQLGLDLFWVALGFIGLGTLMVGFSHRTTRIHKTAKALTVARTVLPFFNRKIHKSDFSRVEARGIRRIQFNPVSPGNIAPKDYGSILVITLNDGAEICLGSSTDPVRIKSVLNVVQDNFA